MVFLSCINLRKLIRTVLFTGIRKFYFKAPTLSCQKFFFTTVVPEIMLYKILFVE